MRELAKEKEIYKGIKVEDSTGLPEKDITEIVDQEIEIWRQAGKTLAEVRTSWSDDEIMVESLERSPIKRLRRITGYLSAIDNFNDAKKAELRDRVAHT